MTIIRITNFIRLIFYFDFCWITSISKPQVKTVDDKNHLAYICIFEEKQNENDCKFCEAMLFIYI